MKATMAAVLTGFALSCGAAQAGMIELSADLNTPARITQTYSQPTVYSANAGLSMRLAVLSDNFRNGDARWRWGVGLGIQQLTLVASGSTASSRDYSATSLEAMVDRKIWSSSDFCLAIGAGGGLVFVRERNSHCNEPLCELGGNWTAFVISRAEYAVSGRVALVAGLRNWLWSPERPFKVAPVLSLGIQVE